MKVKKIQRNTNDRNFKQTQTDKKVNQNACRCIRHDKVIAERIRKKEPSTVYNM